MKIKNLKLVILAGGLGTRFSEETDVKPKPMIEIGGKPIIWHIMKYYSYFGINDFIICLGYKGYVIKEFFSNYFLHNSDVTFDFKENKTTYHQNNSEPWKVTLVDTGLNSMTGGRIKKIESYINTDTFCLTYGDGLSNVNIHDLLAFHKSHKSHATVTGIMQPGRFGILDIENESDVIGFKEKPSSENNLINGGFFVLNKKIFHYIKDDSTVWENDPLIKLSKDGHLKVFKHFDFWHPMDTLRDKIYLESLWNNKKAPWVLNGE